jgi:hypothetical protein
MEAGAVVPTKAQEETALRLADGFIGARARTRIDGVAEVRTLGGGEVRQYLVGPDGTATLVESRPTSRLYRRLDAARGVGCGLVVAAVLWLIVAQAANVHEEALGYVVGLLFVCLMGLFVSEVVMNHEIAPAGELWERVGGADF